MSEQKYYYKATMDGGSSGYDRNFRYKIGVNVHPQPDRKCTDSCGVGIHLAKTIPVAQSFVPMATEFYLAEAGVILGEDDDKVRCASCNIIRKLSQRDINRIRKREILEAEEKKRIAEQEKYYRNMLGGILDNGGLCGADWLKNHMADITQEDIDGLKLEVKGRRTFNLNLTMRKKDRKFLLKEAMA